MYYIIVYDLKSNIINGKKSPNILKLLRQYLHWIQNSVFEGELLISSFNELQNKLNNLIRPEDCLIIYNLKDHKFLKKQILGLEKNSTSNFI